MTPARRGIVYCHNDHALVGVVISERLPRDQIQSAVEKSFRIYRVDVVCATCNSRKFWVALEDELYPTFSAAAPKWMEIPAGTDPACLVLFSKEATKNKVERN